MVCQWKGGTISAMSSCRNQARYKIGEVPDPHYRCPEHLLEFLEGSAGRVERIPDKILTLDDVIAWLEECHFQTADPTRLDKEVAETVAVLKAARAWMKLAASIEEAGTEGR